MPESLDAWVRLLTMLPILASSIVGSALTAAKWWQLHRSRASARRLRAGVLPLLDAGEDGAAIALARRGRSHAGRLVEECLRRRHLTRERLVAHAEHVGGELARSLERGIGGVALVATLGPLLGLFGTVVGIVLAFERLAASEGLVRAHELAGAIGTALYTTVAGLIVGVFALVSHRFLLALADSTLGELEAIAHELVESIDDRSEA